jgi:hypothetical protein
MTLQLLEEQMAESPERNVIARTAERPLLSCAGASWRIQNQCGRVTHGLVGSTPAPLR